MKTAEEKRLAHNAYMRSYNARTRYYGRGASAGYTDRSDRPPAESIEERTRAITAPRSLTSVLMGDPLPGRSALDRFTA